MKEALIDILDIKYDSEKITLYAINQNNEQLILYDYDFKPYYYIEK